MTKSFRIWDKDLCKYVTGSEFGLARMSIRPDEDDGSIFTFATLFPGRYTWEQDTGRRDKNGKEIYEGDIVEYDWYIIGDKPAYRTKEQVVFDDMGARLGDDRIRYCTNVEVIGNIHENPELLEEK